MAIEAMTQRKYTKKNKENKENGLTGTKLLERPVCKESTPKK